MNNLHRGENGTFCYFHPKEAIVGVCPFCLNERLIVLASKQSQRHRLVAPAKSSHSYSSSGSSQRKLSKIFAFSSFLSFRHRKCADDEGSDREVSTSQEDSFISIKFEDNGVASWEKGTVSKVSFEHCNLPFKQSSVKEHKHNPKETKSIIEHTKPHPSIRWRKRMSQLFQLIRWKRSKKVSMCNGGSKVDGVKVRKSWIRNLTRGSS